MATEQSIRSDFDLLQEFIRSRDESAFCELVRRHGKLVLSVCGRVLSREEDVDDAFQMTFLVLARDCAKIKNRRSVVSWLHGVAHRSALAHWRKQYGHAEATFSEYQVNQIQCDIGSLSTVAERDQQRLLDEELMRLPEKFRDPLIRHYLEGQSRNEIASAMGLSITVVKGRLQRGRDTLRKRLSLRGIGVLALIALTRAMESPASAARVEILMDKTLIKVRSGPTIETASWTQGVTMQTTTSFAALAIMSIGFLVISQCQMAPVATAQTLELSATLDSNSVQPVLLAQVTETESTEVEEERTKKPTTVRHGDGKADGKKSLGGSGHLIKFALPSDDREVSGLRLHAARYGAPTPPDEEVEINFLSKDEEEILETEFVKYGKFKRGDSRWVTIKFKKPLKLPKEFWVSINFDPGRTKGVYLSYDTKTKGHSRMGLPGAKSKPVDFEGDWMVQLMLAK